MTALLRRHGLFALTLLACLALIVAEFLELYHVRVITVDVYSQSAGSHHGYALLVVALVAALMGYAAHRSGARPAAAAVAVLGLTALAIVLIVDVPVLDETGLYGRDYEQAVAEPGAGFRLETAGAIALLFAGVTTLVFGTRPAPERRRRAAEPRETHSAAT